MPPPHSMRRTGLLLMLLAANLLWGSAWVVAKLALDDLTPVQVSAWRMIVAGLLVLPWLGFRLRRDPLPASAWPSLILLGFIGFVAAKFLNFWGLNLTTATNASLLMATEPLFTIALGRVVLGEFLGRRRITAFLLGAAGAYLLISDGWRMPDLTSGHSLGDLVFMLGLTGEAAYSVFGKSLLNRRPASVVTMATIATSLGFWVPIALGDGLLFGWPSLTLGSVAAMAYLSIGCTVFAYWAWFYALAELEVGLAALTIFIQPVWGALLAFLLLGEPVSAVTLGGGALVLVSLYLALVPAGTRRGAAPGGARNH